MVHHCLRSPRDLNVPLFLGRVAAPFRCLLQHQGALLSSTLVVPLHPPHRLRKGLLQCPLCPLPVPSSTLSFPSPPHSSNLTDNWGLLLRSLLSSITWLIVHVGCSDTACWHSELTKKDFNDLFSLFKKLWKIRLYQRFPAYTVPLSQVLITLDVFYSQKEIFGQFYSITLPELLDVVSHLRVS